MKYEKVSPSQYVQIFSTLLGLAAVAIGLYVTARLAPVSETIAVVQAKQNGMEKNMLIINDKLDRIIELHLSK